VTDFLLLVGKLAITAGMCALSFHVFTNEVEYKDYAEVPTLNYSFLPMVIIGIGTFFIASMFFEVYSMAVDTLFLCFCKYSSHLNFVVKESLVVTVHFNQCNALYLKLHRYNFLFLKYKHTLSP
jgi:hypothetical protein